MIWDGKYAMQLIDTISEGYICIDSEAKIKIYNEKAKEIFGISFEQGNDHAAGKIAEGDIVVIANNRLGHDDGGLTPAGLARLGIKDDKIENNDAIIVVGTYEDKRIIPKYKNKKNFGGAEVLKLDTNFLGVDITAEIDEKNKNVKVSINGKDFEMHYINAIGYMIIIDRKERKVKFYQAKGYTIRKESIRDILSGKEYRRKGEDSVDINVLGRDIFEVHESSQAINKLFEVAKGIDIEYEDRFAEINGRPTLCTILPIDEEDIRVGALLKVKDISELKKFMKERDEALYKLENMRIKYKEQVGIVSTFPNIIGESTQIDSVRNLAHKASKSNSTVLILGESGTGKTMLAREIHNASANKREPFIHVSCASIPESLLESEFFGYEFGAFTGARNKGKIGYFEMANKGTVFLDEIAEIPVSMQVKLLQVLQDNTFYRVGGTNRISVNVRVIVATNKNLEEEVLKGEFREDLFYRINVFPIILPPLRDRKHDVYLLTHLMLPNICNKIGLERKHISGEALSKLVEYSWPGNIRELQNILERAVNLSEGNTIFSEYIQIPTKKSICKDRLPVRNLKEVVLDAEKKAIEEALDVFSGDKVKTRESLNISKTSFYEKLKKHNISSIFVGK
ncbi:MAG: sigma-54 interaction domain-containing protein [Alkaliphilus sp.]